MKLHLELTQNKIKLFKILYILGCLIAFSLIFTSCGTTVQTETHEEIKLDGYEMRIIVIDSCQYIVFGHENSRAMSHKGNCSNPIHKCK